ncbi:MAG: hypothetical protein IPO92_04675 [Saprospiraceae bacterium]|nr:hypothetical protein [Saprospiraceae bacterium]
MRSLIYILVCFSLPIFAQTDTLKTKIQLNQVEVIKSFEANLEEAEKITIKSVLPVQKPFNPTYKYDITIVPVELKYPAPQIKPLAMNPDGPFQINKAYLRAGYGALHNPEVLAGYHNSKKDLYDTGIHIDYSSLDNSTKNPYQKYANLGARIYGSYMVKENIKLYGGLDVSSKTRYFYHTDLGVDSLFSGAESKRTLNSIIINAGIKNAERTKHDINYDINLALKNLNITNEKARENGISVKGMTEKYFGETTVVMLDGKFEYTGLNADSVFSISTLKFVPTIKTQFGNLIINAGINYINAGNKQSSLLPELLLSFGISGSKLQVFAGVKQDYYTNNLRNVSALNPYIVTNLKNLKNTITRDYFGGVKGQFAFLRYQVKAGYKNVTNQMFLLNSTSDLRQFDMIYDDLNAVYISGNLDFEITENISLGGWMTQHFFDLKTITETWHTPNLEANAFTKIKLFDSKLQITGELFFNNNVPFINKIDVVTSSNILFDVNTSVEYKFTEKIGVFVRGINLLNNKFERWYGYPSVGINAMIGVNVVF